MVHIHDKFSGNLGVACVKRSTDILGMHSMMAPVVLTVGTTLLHSPSHSFFSVFLDQSR